MLARATTTLLALLPALAVLVALVATDAAYAGSETPPEGPPWMRDIQEAQKSAIERKVPIFVYLTKTH